MHPVTSRNCGYRFRLTQLGATVLLLLLASVSARAQTFNFGKDRQPILILDGLWRFHTGDDPRWSSSNFDDSNWKLLRSDQSWFNQGYGSYSGFAWYRFRVEGLPSGMPLSLLLPTILTRYQVFANGLLIATVGGAPPNESLYSSRAEVLRIPSQIQSAALQVAIRVWHSPRWSMYYGGGPHVNWARGVEQSSAIGRTRGIENLFESRRTEVLWSFNSLLIEGVLETVAGLAALGLFLLRTSEREYLWFGLMLLPSAVTDFTMLFVSVHPCNTDVLDLLSNSLGTVARLAEIAFFYRLLAARPTRLFWIAFISALLPVLTTIAEITGLLSIATSNVTEGVLQVPVSLWIISLVLRRWRSGLMEARLLLVPVVVSEGYIFISSLLRAAFNAGWDWDLRTIVVIQHPFEITLDQLINAFFLLSVLAILVGRYARTRRHEERLANELEAARTLQQVLIPEQIAAVPGLQIQAVYKPAQEVGGDLFQVIPLADGTLIAIGDVSGKGLRAAMAVSLIVGTLRTLAEYTQEPAAVLDGLNRRLLGRGTGFTTCLIARIHSNGRVVFANAGHLPPYHNGEEVTLAPDLPLGIEPGISYVQSFLQLEPGDRLTFVSDGVVEAKNAKREMFGFERTKSASVQSAEEIATEAQEFGQEDDITVLTIRRMTVPTYAG